MLVAALLALTGLGLGVPSGSAHVVATPFCTTTGSYSVCSDQQDYVPSATVHLSGSGFASSTAVTIKVTRPDGSVVKSDGTPGSDDLTTSTGGTFQYDYVLNGIAGVYVVEVLDGAAPGGTLLATHTFLDASIDFSQCRNDTNNDNVIDDCEWTSGGINQNNGIYAEGQAVPHRLFHEIDQAGTHTMGFKYQFSQGDVYAYDFLTNVDETMTAGALLNECADLPGFVSAGNCSSLFSGPDANTDLVDVPTDPFDATAARENPPGAGARQFTVGCVPACTSISSSLVFPSINGGDDPGEAHLSDSDPDCFKDCGNSDVQIELTFTTSTTDTLVGVWFGGHLAETADPTGSAIGWGTGCNGTDCGAASVSGAPYHVRYVCLKEPSDPGACGSSSTSVGNRDNQIQGGTIIVEGEPPTLTVNKVLIPSSDPGLFNLRIDGTAEATNVGNGGTTGAIEVTAGAHTVDETAGTGTVLGDYTTVIGGDCDASGSVTLADGEDRVCTITNTLSTVTPPTLTVNKVVINDNGGALGAGDFTLRIDGNPVTNGVATDVTVGKHVVSEDAVPGYSSTISGDCDPNTGSVTLASEENKKCTITNDDIGPTLTVNKVVINDNGGTLGAGDFTLRIDGNPVTNGAATDVTVGKHVVSEDAVPGYSSTISGDCAPNTGSVTLALGENKKCTITNDDDAPPTPTNTPTPGGPTPTPIGGFGSFPDTPAASLEVAGSGQRHALGWAGLTGTIVAAFGGAFWAIRRCRLA